MRARSLVAAAALLAAASGAARAEACGAQRDFLTRGDPVLAPVRPADCARVLPEVAALAWPARGGASSYIVTLVHPDGRVEVRETPDSTLAWDRGLEPGTYTWRVSVAGSTIVSEARSFTVQGG